MRADERVAGALQRNAGGIDRIDWLLTLGGDLDPAQRAKLLEIANKCPVHRTLHSDVRTPTKLG